MRNRIAIIEDDAAIRDILQIILENADYSVSVYDTGETLLNEQSEHVDLFLIDKQLPGIDGFAICKQLKSQSDTSKIPVIIITAFPALRYGALAAGADAIIEKPFSRLELLSKISNLVTSGTRH
jgi:DNA-binding response OmpR family regulator